MEHFGVQGNRGSGRWTTLNFNLQYLSDKSIRYRYFRTQVRFLHTTQVQPKGLALAGKGWAQVGWGSVGRNHRSSIASEGALPLVRGTVQRTVAIMYI